MPPPRGVIPGCFGGASGDGMQKAVALFIDDPPGYPPPYPRALVTLWAPWSFHHVGSSGHTRLFCPPARPRVRPWTLAAARGVAFLAGYHPPWLERASLPAPRVLEGMTRVDRASGHTGAGIAIGRPCRNAWRDRGTRKPVNTGSSDSSGDPSPRRVRGMASRIPCVRYALGFGWVRTH